jgi:hypothetical protein
LTFASSFDKYAIEAETHSHSMSSEDFMRIVSRIDPESRRRALKLYRLGLRRGLREATDWFADETITCKNGCVYAPRILEMKVGITFSGLARRSHTFGLKAKDIGFK